MDLIFRLTGPKSLPPSRRLPEDASKADSKADLGASRSPHARRAIANAGFRYVLTLALEDAAYAVVVGTSSPTGDAWPRQIREAREVSQSMTRVDVNCSRMSPIEGIEGSVSS